MSYTNRSSSRRSVTLAEEQAWIGFYKRVGDAAVAAELIQYLEADPELKRAHAALYLRAKESVRRHQQREARAKRIGAAVRMVAGAIVIAPVSAVRRLFRAGGEVAIACLPETQVPNAAAARQAKRLGHEAQYAKARGDFKRGSASAPLPGAQPSPKASGGLGEAARPLSLDEPAQEPRVF